MGQAEDASASWADRLTRSRGLRPPTHAIAAGDRRYSAAAEPQGVVNGRVDVPVAHRVADPEQLERSVRVAHERLRPHLHQRAVVDRAEVRRRGFSSKYSSSSARVPWSTTTQSTRRVVRCDDCSLPSSTMSRPTGPTVSTSRRTAITFWCSVIRGVALVERPRVRHVVHAADLDAEHPLGRDDLEIGARPGDQLRRRQRGVGAVVVVEEHVAGRLDVAAEHVPARDDEVGAGFELGELRLAARGDDHDIGRERPNEVGVGVRVVADVDTEPRALGDAPVDDALEVLAARVAHGEVELAAGPRHRLEQHDVVPPLARDPGGLEPGRPGPDDHHAARRRRRSMSCGIVCSRLVAALWRHSASPAA